VSCARSSFVSADGLTDFVQKAYEDYLLGVATLSTLPDRPTFVFNTTNLATGVSFRISKPYAADYRIGMIEKPLFRVALAVTASSAFPPSSHQSSSRSRR
jgi:NTE family protein